MTVYWVYFSVLFLCPTEPAVSVFQLGFERSMSADHNEGTYGENVFEQVTPIHFVIGVKRYAMMLIIETNYINVHHCSSIMQHSQCNKFTVAET